MLVSAQGIYGILANTHFLRTERWEGTWRGFLYLDGIAAGEKSVLKFLEHVTSPQELVAKSGRLKGTYFLALRDAHSGNHYAFVDPGGLFHAFYSARYAATSFLELAAAEKAGAGDIEPEALVEFFHFGSLSFGKTLFSTIRRLDPESVLCVSALDRTELLPRPVRDLNSPPVHSFEQCLTAFTHSVVGEKVSVDLTGGIDSRLLAVMLDYLSLPFELAISGVQGNTDITLAERVAGELKHPLHVAHHDVDGLEGSLPEMFSTCDGSFDVLKAHRPLQLQRQRRQRGISLSVTSVGGELFNIFGGSRTFRFTRANSRTSRAYTTLVLQQWTRDILIWPLPIEKSVRNIEKDS